MGTWVNAATLPWLVSTGYYSRTISDNDRAIRALARREMIAARQWRYLHARAAARNKTCAVNGCGVVLVRACATYCKRHAAQARARRMFPNAHRRKARK